MPAKNKKNILVSPLNWGLGHATRLIPVIDVLVKKGHNVFIGAYGQSAVLLKSEFPECTHVELKGFTPYYTKKYSQTFSLFLQSFSFLYHKIKERRITSQIVSENNIDLIISDNRYGVRYKDITSVIITHQTSPVLSKGFKLFRKPVAFFLSSWIRKFDHCWIPDVQDKSNFSGSLSNNPSLKNIIYTGLLSRFNACAEDVRSAITYLAIISGPEPWRTIFENEVISMFNNTEKDAVVVRGLPEEKRPAVIPRENVTVYDHCDAQKLNELICKAENIICRSGYSSIMDLLATGRKALLVPTPGQPEQEYLAKHLVKYHGFSSVQQDELSLSCLNPSSSEPQKLSPVEKNIFIKTIEKIIK